MYDDEYSANRLYIRQPAVTDAYPYHRRHYKQSNKMALSYRGSSNINDYLDSAVIEATFLFVAGISKLYQSRQRTRREMNIMETEERLALRQTEGQEEVMLVEDLRFQYQENVRVASA